MSLKKSILFLFCIIIGAKITIAQTNGCTDFQAKNFNPNASINDGSCLYNNTSYSPVKLIDKLSDTINETSGIINLNGELWTIDDSGNPNAIYHFDKNSGTILQTIYISNAINHDWEEISADANYIYIGDFGNNNGNRTALAVYKISINQITSKKVDTITAQKISFSYSDQIDFTSQNNATRFDCEAMFIWNDSIHLLSKDWVAGHSKHYVLSTIPGTYAIAPRDSFDAECMITGATFDSPSKRIVLCGYNKTGFCFLWLLWDFTSDKIFSGNKRKIDLGFFTGTGQVEGVCFKDSNNIYLTNENYIVSNKLCAANIGQWVNKKITGVNFKKQNITGLVLFPNPAATDIEVSYELQKPASVSYCIYNSEGKIVYCYKTKLAGGSINQKINIAGLANGTYYLIVHSEKANTEKKVFVKQDLK